MANCQFRLADITDGTGSANVPYDTSTYMQCPYNNDHTIATARMQFHLDKCRKAHPNLPKVNCPFDRTHWLNEPELAYHVTVCPQRIEFDQFAYSMENKSHPAAVEPPSAPYVPPSDENWDDSACAAYDPQQSLEGRTDVLRKLAGAQPAERRKFNNAQRQRHGSAKNNVTD